MVSLGALISIVESLLNTPRTGWIQRGVPQCVAESIGDHTLLTTYLTLELAFRLRAGGIDVDVGKCLIMALTHDAHEALTGNPSWRVRRSFANWAEFEIALFKEVLPEYSTLFEEYRLGKSLEGKVVIFCDKLATYIRACLYASIYREVEELVRKYEEAIKEALSGFEAKGRVIAEGLFDEAKSWCYNRTCTTSCRD